MILPINFALVILQCIDVATTWIGLNMKNGLCESNLLFQNTLFNPASLIFKFSSPIIIGIVCFVVWNKLHVDNDAPKLALFILICVTAITCFYVFVTINNFILIS